MFGQLICLGRPAPGPPSAAYRSPRHSGARLAKEGDTLPPSRRATADWVVPRRRASSSACVSFAAVRARTNACSRVLLPELRILHEALLQIPQSHHSTTCFIRSLAVVAAPSDGQRTSDIVRNCLPGVGCASGRPRHSLTPRGCSVSRPRHFPGHGQGLSIRP